SVLAWPLIFAGVCTLGLFHGLLITKLRLQPFVVTLCGLLIYRGVARWITSDNPPVGLPRDARELALAVIPLPFGEEYVVPLAFLMLIGVAVVAAVFLN